MVVLLDLDDDDAIIDPRRTRTYISSKPDTSEVVIASAEDDNEEGVSPMGACVNLNSFSAALGCYP